MKRPETLLRIVLLACGIGCVSGLPAMFMPRSWMASTHEWLGMGPFPDGPLGEYLARLCTGLYAMYGGFVVMIAMDVRRYAPIITFQAVALLGLAVVGAAYGWPLGVPRWWLIGDVGPVIFFSSATLILQAIVRVQDRRPATADGLTDT